MLLITLLITIVIVIIITLKLIISRKYPRVVVSLTTSPKRISFIKPVIDSICNQIHKPDRIYLNLPNVFKRDNTRFESPLPDFITENPLVYVNFCEDIGPATKIIPAIEHENDPNTYILSIDDDIHYPEYIIKIYLQYARIYQDSIITGRSFVKSNRKADVEWFNNIKNKQTPIFGGNIVYLLEGFSGVLYKRKIFTKQLLSDFYKSINNSACRFGDDFNLSNLFTKYSIKIVSLNIPVNTLKYEKNKVSVLDYGLQNDALHKGAAGGNNDNYKKCSSYLNNLGELYIDVNCKNCRY